jgi:hypothetical protein
MEFHKPKPIHNWREFLKEYAIIVLGVATALAAEQGVEWLHLIKWGKAPAWAGKATAALPQFARAMQLALPPPEKSGGGGYGLQSIISFISASHRSGIPIPVRYCVRWMIPNLPKCPHRLRGVWYLSRYTDKRYQDPIAESGHSRRP